MKYYAEEGIGLYQSSEKEFQTNAVLLACSSGHMARSCCVLGQILSWIFYMKCDLFHGNSLNINSKKQRAEFVSYLHTFYNFNHKTDDCQPYKLMFSCLFFLIQKSLQLQLKLSLRTMA